MPWQQYRHPYDLHILIRSQFNGLTAGVRRRSDRLPTAHTCFNALMLSGGYKDKATLDRVLAVAIEHSEVTAPAGRTLFAHAAH